MRQNHSQLIQGFIIKLILVLSASPVTFAQTQEVRPLQLPAAPPFRAISSTEREQLQQVEDAKGRIRKNIELASARLQRAEELVAQQKYDHALMELGGYLALIDDAFHFLGRLDHERDKIRDQYKRIELALRSDGPRLVALRRGAPLEYAIRIKEVEESARDGRTEALNSFYGHTVMREGKQKPDEDNKPKSTLDKP